MCIDEEIINIKKELSKNKIHIISFNDVDFFLLEPTQRRMAIEFDNNVIKNYFVSETTEHIINCNGSYNKFYEDMEKYFDKFTIFNNLDECNDLDILNTLKNTNNIILL